MNKTGKTNLTTFAAYLLIPTSGFYLAGITSYSPIYFFTLTTIFIFYLLLVFKKSLVWGRFLSVCLCTLMYFAISQLFLSPNIGPYANIVLDYSYFILTFILLKKLPDDRIINIIKWFNILSIAVLTIELIWRISHPVFVQYSVNGEEIIYTGKSFFYAYKLSSLMFQDSNFVGIYSMIMCFFNYYLIEENINKSRIFILLFSFFSLCTLSRSIIITTILSFLILYIIFKKTNPIKKVINLLILIIVTSIIYFLIKGDSSFGSKFYIIFQAIAYLKNASINHLLFGVGFGNAANYLGMGAHNLYIIYIVESGVIGFTFFLFFQFYSILRTHKKSLFLIIPLLISGFSLVGHAIPFYFVCLSIIFYTQKINKEI